MATWRTENDRKRVKAETDKRVADTKKRIADNWETADWNRGEVGTDKEPIADRPTAG